MEAARPRALALEAARELIALHQVEGTTPADAVRSAGAQRLARACVAQSPELAARLLERHRGTFGQSLMRWVREERAKGRPGDGGRTEVLAEIEAMVAEGLADRPLRAPPRQPTRPEVRRRSRGVACPEGGGPVTTSLPRARQGTETSRAASRPRCRIRGG